MRGSARPSRVGFRPPARPRGRCRRPAVARGFAGPCPAGSPPRGPLRLSGALPRPSLGGLAARCPPSLPSAAAAAPGGPVPRAVSLARPSPPGRCGPPCGGGRPLGRLRGRPLRPVGRGASLAGRSSLRPGGLRAAAAGLSALALAPPARALCGPAARPFPRRARASLGLGFRPLRRAVASRYAPDTKKRASAQRPPSPRFNKTAIYFVES